MEQKFKEAWNESRVREPPSKRTVGFCSVQITTLARQSRSGFCPSLELYNTCLLIPMHTAARLIQPSPNTTQETKRTWCIFDSANYPRSYNHHYSDHYPNWQIHYSDTQSNVANTVITSIPTRKTKCIWYPLHSDNDLDPNMFTAYLGLSHESYLWQKNQYYSVYFQLWPGCFYIMAVRNSVNNPQWSTVDSMYM